MMSVKRIAKRLLAAGWLSAAGLAWCVSAAHPALAFSPSVERELDCRGDKACQESYRQKKNDWLACLSQAGLSERKRKKLDLKQEAIGLRNLRKEEVLILDSKRKDCHKNFSEALSGLKAAREKELTDKPPPLDLLDKDKE